MVEKLIARGRNVIDLSTYRQRSHSPVAQPLVASRNYCSHCGAWLAEGESEDECSTLDAGTGFRATRVQ
ncbi:MAG TPA: hypothetical protein VN130_02925 [Xanthobacteraceae bacterium]|nr:hypothetical protein [Xanthobacteraceae bacterium]